MSHVRILAVALNLLAAGCTTPVPPSTTAPPTRFVYVATLSALNEVPPVTNAESGARGQATLTLNVTRDAAGAITAATFDVLATFTGFPAGTSVTLAHIHQGVAGATGVAVIPMNPSAAEVTFPNGTGSYVRTGFQVVPVDIANQIIANPAGFFFDVHTPLNPNGAARGQLGITGGTTAPGA